MEDILRKLYEIESTASRITDDVLSQKQNLARQMEEEIKSFDDKTNVQIQQTLDKTREKLEAENRIQLESLAAQTDAAVSKMDDFYQKHHTHLAREILEKIIRK